MHLPALVLLSFGLSGGISDDAQGVLLAMVGGSCGTWWVEPESTTYKVHTLPAGPEFPARC